MHLWMHTVRKNCEKKNQCVDSSPISFFFIDIIEYREGGQNSCKKKEFYELIELTSH